MSVVGSSRGRFARQREPVGEKQRAQLPSANRCVGVALAGSNNRTLHQDVPLTSKSIGISHACVRRQLGYEIADAGQLTTALAMHRV